MFTGIVEQIAEVVELRKEKFNLHILCKSPITNSFIYFNINNFIYLY